MTRKVMIILLSVGIFLWGEVASTLASEKPVLWFCFDEGKGDTVKDSSGNNNHGRINKATWVKGGFGSALKFDRGDYIDCGKNKSLDINEAITLETWIKATDLSIPVYVVAKEWRWYIRVMPAGAIAFFTETEDGSNWLNTNEGIIELEKWYHIVSTYDSNREKDNQKVYVNGTLAKQRTVSGRIKTSNAPVTIGKYSENDHFQGLVGKVRIYPHALTIDEIKSHFNKEKTKYISFSPLPKESRETKYIRPEETVSEKTTGIYTATYVIAAKNSRDRQKADYVCDGVSDQAEIQIAIDALPPKGGKVSLLEGEFLIKNTIYLPSNVTLEGQGPGSTIIKRDPNVKLEGIIQNKDWKGGGNKNIRIADLMLDGQYPPAEKRKWGGSLIDFCKVTDSSIERVHLLNAYHQCLELCRCKRVRVVQCVGDGSGDDIFSVTDNAHPGGASGISESQDIWYISCVARNPFDAGFEIDDGPKNIFYLLCVAENCAFNPHCHADEIPPSGIRYIGCTGSFNISGRDDYSANTQDVTIANCVINGFGITCASNVKVYGCHINNRSSKPGWGSAGLLIFKKSDTIEIIGNTFKDIGFDAIILCSHTKTISDITVAHNHFENVNGKFISLDIEKGKKAENISIVHNTMKGKPREGDTSLVINNSGILEGLRIESNDIYDPNGGLNHAIYIKTGEGGITKKVRILNNNLKGIKKDAILFTGKGVNEGVEIRGNDGYITENSGIATVLSDRTYVEVKHDLHTTPNIGDIQVTPINNLGNAAKFWASHPTATTFRINVNAVPGSGNTAEFVWRVADTVN